MAYIMFTTLFLLRDRRRFTPQVATQSAQVWRQSCLLVPGLQPIVCTSTRNPLQLVNEVGLRYKRPVRTREVVGNSALHEQPVDQVVEEISNTSYFRNVDPGSHRSHGHLVRTTRSLANPTYGALRPLRDRIVCSARNNVPRRD